MNGRGAGYRVAAAFLLCLTTLVAGCAGPSVSTGGSDLTIVYDEGRGGVVTTWTLTCDPLGGSHPDAEAACKALTQNATSALPAVPADQVCTQNIGGPQTASVTGRWNDADVDSRFTLANGCEIARWQALTGLLPVAGR